MSVFEMLSSPEAWEEFFTYRKDSRHMGREEEADFRKFIDGKDYLEVVAKIQKGETFSPPRKALIRKTGSEKKRTVYTYGREENYVLKLLTFLLLRSYDALFCDNLYSFRVSHGVGRAMNRILGTPGLRKKYTYKVDIHNYFNSVDVEKMVCRMREKLSEEPEILGLLTRLLEDDRAEEHGKIVHEKKGIMAGTPFAVFLANLYLLEMDKWFQEKEVLYARYSDDIIVFADTEEERDAYRQRILAFLENYGLTVNPEKEIETGPSEKWTFLGIEYDNGVIDISEISKRKLKDKMHRRVRALKRWQARKGATNEQTAKAFVKAFNRKFFEAADHHELTWARWYFPLITTDESLHEIDLYMQDCIRYLATGKRSKARFNFRYEDMKNLGYRSLVNAYYKGWEESPAEEISKE